MDDDLTIPPGGTPPDPAARTRDRLAEFRLLVPRPAVPPAPTESPGGGAGRRGDSAALITPRPRAGGWAHGWITTAGPPPGTLGEEVRDPTRTIPRAVPLALGLVLAVYALVAVAALTAAGPAAPAGFPAPPATAAGPGFAPLVHAGGGARRLSPPRTR